MLANKTANICITASELFRGHEIIFLGLKSYFLMKSNRICFLTVGPGEKV